MMTGCGRMILGSDSHTRYGALGTMGIGEGGGELAKQLVGRTYDIAYPKTVLVHVTGETKPGVGPHDVALALVAATYENGFVKNTVMEFAGEGIHTLSQDFRNGIDVMTTETTCLSSIWETDEKTREYFEKHGRPQDYKELRPADGAYYDRCIELDLSEIECMIALPMHPSLAVSIHELQKDPEGILAAAQAKANGQLGGKVKMDLTGKIHNGKVVVDQGIIAGCSGGVYENIIEAARIIKGKDTGNGEFRLSVYPDSLPAYKALLTEGVVTDLVTAGVIFREAFCGPCFGAGDTPANGEFSIRHTTRNFPNREGSKPGEGQISAVALMDARSIAATAVSHGVLTAASDIITEKTEIPVPEFDAGIYDKRVYNGFGREEPEYELIMGPNIKDWPALPALKENLLVQIVSHLEDPVTTTDELIPSGETSSFRSNPLRLAEFTLSRRDPQYVARAKEVQNLSQDTIQEVLKAFADAGIAADPENTNVGSSIYAHKPGDGSAREQAASCQRVLGASCNFAGDYATKRYRSNCINWGMIPFLTKEYEKLPVGAWVLLKHIDKSVETSMPVEAYVCSHGEITPLAAEIGTLTKDERQILLDGCLINHYRRSLN